MAINPDLIAQYYADLGTIPYGPGTASMYNPDGWVNLPTGGKALGFTNGLKGSFAMDSLGTAQGVQQKYGGNVGTGFGKLNDPTPYMAGEALTAYNGMPNQDPGQGYYWTPGADTNIDQLRELGLYADPSWMDQYGMALAATLMTAGVASGVGAGAGAAAGAGGEVAGIGAGAAMEGVGAGIGSGVGGAGMGAMEALGSLGAESAAEMAAMEALGTGLPYMGAAPMTAAEYAAAMAAGSSMPGYLAEVAANGWNAANALPPGSVPSSGTTPPTTTPSGNPVTDWMSNPANLAKAGLTAATLASTAGGSKQTGEQTATTQNKLDPRMDNMLYGENGLLPGAMGLLNTPMKAGMNNAGVAADNFMGQFTAQDLELQRAAAGKLMNSNTAAPTMNAATAGYQGMTPTTMQAAQANAGNNGMYNPATAQSAQINGPGQNNLGLLSAYNDMIYGNPAENPYLTGAIQKGINQSTGAFNDYLGSAQTAVQDVLSGIRGSSVSNGAYGGSRQGIAEGRAVSEFGKNLTQAASRFGQNNTDAAVAAQAGAFDAGQNRALNAMSGLSGNQYNTAAQNAGFQQQTGLSNAGFLNSAGQFNAGQGSNMAQFNAGLQQQANLANAGYLNQGSQFNANAFNNNSQYNAGLLQNANQANLQSQLTTNQLNSNNQLSGIGASQNVMNNAYGMGQNYDAYNLNKYGKVGGLLQPFTGLNSTATQSQPLYENKAANVIGGLGAVASLWNAFK